MTDYSKEPWYTDQHRAIEETVNRIHAAAVERARLRRLAEFETDPDPAWDRFLGEHPELDEKGSAEDG